MNVHVKAPVAEIVTPVQVCVAGVAPLNVIVPIVVGETENPEPVTVTEVPTAPEVGDRVIAGLVTVKVAVPVSELASVAVTDLAPEEVEDGTTKVAVKVPVADVVTVAGTVVSVVPASFIVILEEAAK